MIIRIAHVCIIARDLAETEHFYCTVLGMTKKFEFQKHEERIGFYLHAGGSTFIEVFKGDSAGPSLPIRHICLETDDIDAVRRQLEQHGLTATAKTLGCDHSWQIWCKDPNGVDIEFHEYTDNSLQKTGGVARLT